MDLLRNICLHVWLPKSNYLLYLPALCVTLVSADHSKLKEVKE